MINLPVTLVVPTCNMSKQLQPILDSLLTSGLAQACEIVLFVNDASTDNTQAVLEKFRDDNNLKDKVQILTFKANKGRFDARKEGALATTSKNLLYLDTRIEIPNGFVTSFAKLIPQYKVIQGTVRIPSKESIYSLYWERSHQFIFKNHYKDQTSGFWLIPENYEKYTCGTTIFYCERKIFIEACNKFPTTPLSDDRALIKVICEMEKIWVTDQLEVIWRPRQTLSEYIFRIWERGPTFVAYHVYDPGSHLKWPIFLGLVILLLNLLIMIFNSSVWPSFALIQFTLIAMTVIFFTRNPIEIIKLTGLHLAVVFTFGFGVLWGLIKEFPFLAKRDKNE